ncbi:hypothetical protein D3C81_1253790 [compost metagenome]
MRSGQGLLSQLQLRFEVFTLLGENAFGLLDAYIRLFLQLSCQLPNKPSNRIAQPWGARRRHGLLAIELLQVAMDRAFRAGITQLDTYRIDAGIFPAGDQRLTRLLHYNLVDTAPGHACSYDFVMWYVTCNYVPILTGKRPCFKCYLTWNNHGLSHVNR